MKVLWLTHRDLLDARAGGAERTVYEVSRRLVSRGHSVVWSSVGSGGSIPNSLDNGIILHRFSNNIEAHLRQLTRPKADLAADVVIDDLAHAVPWCTPQFSRAPTVAFFHHLHRRTAAGQVGPFLAAAIRMVELTYPILYRGAPFVTESASSYSDLLALGCSRKQVHVIPPGVDTDTFRPGTRTSHPTIVYFGGLKAYKRPEIALRVLHKLSREFPNLKCVIAGSGPALDGLKTLAAELSLNPAVQFVGKVSLPKLAQLVSSAWVNLHCSVSEGWGFSTLEAAAAGVPTVSFEVPGVRDAVKQGVSGILVQEGDMTAFTNAVRSVLRFPDAWTEPCRRFALGFSWDKATDRWQELLSATAHTSSLDICR